MASWTMVISLSAAVFLCALFVVAACAVYRHIRRLDALLPLHHQAGETVSRGAPYHPRINPHSHHAIHQASQHSHSHQPDHAHVREGQQRKQQQPPQELPEQPPQPQPQLNDGNDLGADDDNDATLFEREDERQLEGDMPTTPRSIASLLPPFSRRYFEGRSRRRNINNDFSSANNDANGRANRRASASADGLDNLIAQKIGLSGEQVGLAAPRISNASNKTGCSSSRRPTVSICSICLDDFGQNDDIRMVMVCGHRFHSVCIHSWLQRVNKCPNCQRTALQSYSMDGSSVCSRKSVAGRRPKRRTAVDSVDRLGRESHLDVIANVNVVSTAEASRSAISNMNMGVGAANNGRRENDNEVIVDYLLNNMT